MIFVVTKVKDLENGILQNFRTTATINLGVEKNMISNEYAVKLYLEHEVKRGNKVVKKELIVALRGEIYFVKFIINPREMMLTSVNFKISFLRMTKAITDFGAGTVSIYHEFDLFLEDIEEEEKSLDDWDHLLDFNLDYISLLGGEELSPFICKMGKSSHNKKRSMENLSFFYQDIGISSSAGGHLTQEEGAKEALAIRISQKFALLEEVELDGKIIKEEEEAVKSIKGEALKEKDDPGAFIFHIRLERQVNKNALADTGSDINTMPYRIYEQLGREEMKKVDRGIMMINHTQAEAMGILINVLCQCLVEGRLVPCSLPVPSKHVNWKPDYKGSYTKEEEATGQWRTKIRLTAPYGNICLQGFITKKTDRKLLKYHKLWEHTMMRSDHQDPNASRTMKPWKKEMLNRMGCDGEIDDMLRIRLREAESNEEIFTFVAWIRAFNINEPIYAELCHEFYSTYEFDEVCADDELQIKKIIKFRLGGHAYNLTFDEHFNAQKYWLSIIEKKNLGLSRSHTSTIRSPILRVIHKMITYALCQRTIRGKELVLKRKVKFAVDKFISKIARKSRVLTDDVVRSLSAPIYCRDLDTTPLRDLIDSEGTLYDFGGGMEIRQEAIEQMEYRQSYHWDRYHGVFEHMAGVYSVPLQGAYNPPGYAQPQCD
ncbi:hypothetical protein Tco_0162419 [Tanacetum coccineum]